MASPSQVGLRAGFRAGPFLMSPYSDIGSDVGRDIASDIASDIGSDVGIVSLYRDLCHCIRHGATPI